MDTKKLEAWADKSGQSVADLEAKYKDIFAPLPSSVLCNYSRARFNQIYVHQQLHSVQSLWVQMSHEI